MRAGILTKTNHLFSLFMFTLIAVVVLGLAGCGGGGGGSDSTQTTTPSESGSGVVSAGQITGFGSIIVNDVRFHTGGAELEMEDGSTIPLTNTNNEDHLSRGMEVEIEGSIDDNGNGTATRVSVDSTLDGPIANLSQTGDVFTFTITK